MSPRTRRWSPWYAILVVVLIGACGYYWKTLWAGYLVCRIRYAWWSGGFDASRRCAPQYAQLRHLGRSTIPWLRIGYHSALSKRERYDWRLRLIRIRDAGFLNILLHDLHDKDAHLWAGSLGRSWGEVVLPVVIRRAETIRGWKELRGLEVVLEAVSLGYLETSEQPSICIYSGIEGGGDLCLLEVYSYDEIMEWFKRAAVEPPLERRVRGEEWRLAYPAWKMWYERVYGPLEDAPDMAEVQEMVRKGVTRLDRPQR